MPQNPLAPVVVTTIAPAQWSVLQSAELQTDVIQVWQVAQVVIVKNELLETQKTCYKTPESVTVTLWKEQVEKDLVMYQWLLRSYWLTKFQDTDSYKPANWLKRYKAAKMFVEFARNILCRQKKTTYDNVYSDIDNVDPTLKPYIIEAYEYGIMKWANQLFRPTDNITNKEFIAILIRMFTNQNLDITGQGNNWDATYKQVYQRYGLDGIVAIGEEIDRYDISKILYQLYFEKHYLWTNAGYILPQK